MIKEYLITAAIVLLLLAGVFAFMSMMSAVSVEIVPEPEIVSTPAAMTYNPLDDMPSSY